MGALTDEEKRNLADPHWRIRHLYTIITDDGVEMPFVPNDEQLQLVENLWTRNLVLKARQLGLCVDPSTRVLTASLEWVPIGSIEPGVEVVAVDEHPPGGRGKSRRMKTATVMAVNVMQAPRFRIAFDDGRHVICTDRHPWLSKKAGDMAEWRSICGAGNEVVGRLKVGTKVRWIAKPWDAPTVEDGWFGGLLDGESSMALPARAGAAVSVSQRPGVVWDHMEKYAAVRGYTARIEGDAAERRRKHGKVPVPKLAFTRMDEMFRLIGQTRPKRFIGRRWWEGRELPGKRNGDVGWSAIVSIEPIGVGDVVDMQTSAGTYIAEGFVSHNTTLIAALGLDQCLFNENFCAVVIADTLPNAEKIFRNKVKRVYDNLPLLVRQFCPLERETASELIFANGSSISVTTSARSGTVNFLHVSEMGKIARKYPEKAREIVTGSFEAVPKDGIIIVESTAEGSSGWFYDACIEAHKRQKQGSRQTALDWRLHFFPWWKAEKYALDTSGVVIRDSEHRYFDRLLIDKGIKLSTAQKAWWVKKAATLGDDMKREYPATVEEAFEQSTDGLIYGKQMMLLRELGRIGKVPVHTSYVVNTFWDLGVNDINAIWLHQRVGAMNRFVKYIWASNEGIAYYWAELEKFRQQHDFRWGEHWLPHDGDARIQGHEVTTRKQILEECGARNVEIVPRTPDLRTAIDLVKRVLPECEFDADGCADGIKALDNYCREWDDARQTWASHPRHDWASNGADAFRQFAQRYNPPSVNVTVEAPTFYGGRAGY